MQKQLSSTTPTRAILFELSWVEFSSRWYLRAWKSHYVLGKFTMHLEKSLCAWRSHYALEKATMHLAKPLCAWKSHYALHSVSQKFPQRCLETVPTFISLNPHYVHIMTLTSFLTFLSVVAAMHSRMILRGSFSSSLSMGWLTRGMAAFQ